jgi:aminopeptidase N
MSEGFANFSVSLYLASTNKNLNEFHDFWKEQLRNLTERNRFGVRPIDVGPLTMGQRVANEKTGDVYQDLIYSKGAYVMHMLQVMYWTPQQGEAPFRRSMQEFVKEYAGKAATTEDLQHSFERTMPKWLDLRHDGKLDWFFNEYVYGTELPHYDVEGEFTTGADGETTMHFKVTQSHVSKEFAMIVPLYVQLADGRTSRIVDLTLKGEAVSDHTVKIGKLPSPAKKVLVNYNYDVLSN